jgi:alpha-tubulin suppressor-like RCC1 family protein
VGSNPVTVLVAAESGAEKDYTVIVKRPAASTNANLANLTLSSGWLSPALNLDTTSYTAEVAYAIPSITVTATVSGLNASLTIKGTPVTSGAASDSIALSPGNNRIDVVVTAEDGTTTKTYTVTVNRIAASTNANLAGLSLSSGTLSPGFAADTTSYSTEIPYSISSITVTPVVAGLNAKVKVNGTTVVSGTASSSLNMSIGDNTISVAVTAESGATKTYTISVNRLNIYGYLSSLTVSQGVLPFFNKDVTSYSMDVPDSVTAITVTPVASSSVHSLIEVNGSPVASGAPSGLIDLSMGSNTITIIVTGDDGTHSTYSLLINRIGLSDLLNFKISCGWNYTMIIRNDGSLWGTGYNYYGQFGNGTNVWYMTTSIRNMDNVASVSAGSFHTMIIKTDGSLWATGRNDYGQLGDGTISDRSTPVHIMDSVAFVSAFDNHTIIIKKDGSLWGTGHNYYGQLSDGSTFESDISTPVHIMDNVASVSAGRLHTMIIKTDGSLWATGYNYYGQLGDGTKWGRYTPVHIRDNVATVSAGGFHT